MEGDAIGDVRSEFERRLESAFEVRQTVEHESTRSGLSQRAFDVDPADHPALLVEDTDTGLLSWSFPAPRRSGRTVEFEFSIDPPSQDRGPLGFVAHKVLRLLVPKAADVLIAKAGQSVARYWEEHKRPERLRRFDPEAAGPDAPAAGGNGMSADDHPAPANAVLGDGQGANGTLGEEMTVDPARLTGGPVLLLLHGPLTTTASGFADVRGLGLARLSERYQGRIIGYDHFTLSKSPEDNANALVAALGSLGIQELSLDVLAHSRGGLVARKLAERAADPSHGLGVGNIWFVGTPNTGTPLCDTDHLSRFADRIMNILSWIPLGAIGDTIDGVLAVVQHLLLTAAGGLPGVAAMDPRVRAVDRTPLPASVHSFGIASNFAPIRSTPLPERARHLLADRLLGGPNDLFVPSDSVFGPAEQPVVPPAHRLTLTSSEGVSHNRYFAHPDTVTFVLQGSSDELVTTRSGAPQVAVRQQASLGEDTTVVELSVSHASLEEARYGLMVGTFGDESLSGAERYLDARMAGALRARYDVDHYPGPLGSSMFIDPDPDAPTMPPAAYVVGLGPTTELGRAELTHAVRQALLDRCLRLYDTHHPSGTPMIEVGVSSILMGVRNNDCLSIADAVAGIAQGVLNANAGLARYEATLGASYSGPSVRITRLEFVERYGDRADDAAAAVRALPASIRLPPGYEYLENVMVNEKPGGLPAGSAVAEGPMDWRRFLITEVPADAEPTTPGADTGRGTLVLDVALLGGDARSDRVRHRLNRSIVDALADQLAADPGDTETAGTLYDHLVPEQMRQRFKTSGSVQLIVDALTANYPWELLTAPRPGGTYGRQALAVSGSVLRQFVESGDRRLNVNRATKPAALVIGAGNVQGQNPLPAAHEETRRVADELDDLYDVTLLQDIEQPLGIIKLSNELYGNHRILHIASHGDYVEGDPGATGAILAGKYLLTADIVRQIRWVPDLVFLNCCSLGRIGLPRMAAGLAREFMAIGARAVVAAGWPIADAAAFTFAETFYEKMLGGEPLGNAVAAARLRCSEKSTGGQTWAAYQCYGDPAFELAISRSKQTAAMWDPISTDDLRRRITSLGIRASDLRRVDGAGLSKGRTVLIAALERLERWADARNLQGTVDIQRLFAQVARQIGEFGRAADRYRLLITSEDGKFGLTTHGSVDDLRQYANCFARDARRRIYEADTTGGQPSSPTERRQAVEDLRSALAAARTAVKLLDDDESHAILGSTLKKLAAVDRARREKFLRESVEAYRLAAAKSESRSYGEQNAIQLAALLSEETSFSTAIGTPMLETPDVAKQVVDERARPSTDFWGEAEAGDRAVSRFLWSTAGTDGADHQRAIVDAYTRAFATRSTWSERNSTLEHLRDLVALLGTGDPRREVLKGVLTELDQWERENVPELGVEVTAPETVAGSAAAAQISRDRRRPGQVEVVALPAGRGDCLWVDYANATEHHRLLIDGGVGSAYANGLRAFLKRIGAGRPADVDILVVTHVDLDHIEGAIEALRSGAVTFGDVWFNGFTQPLDERGPRQGDEFEALLPYDKRNRVAAGRHLVVREEGALPAYPLPGGARCTLLSPTEHRLKRLLDLWATSSNRGAPLSIKELSARLDSPDDDLAERGGAARPFGGDASVANGSSIAFLFEHGGVTALFTGDAFSSVLERSIARLLTDTGQARLRLDLFKLSHHGSQNNITPELLELVDCDRFLVCTDGWKGKHPAHETIDLIQRLRPSAEILFNYDNEYLSCYSSVTGARLAAAGGEPLRITL